MVLLAGIMSVDFATLAPAGWRLASDPNSRLKKPAQQADIAQFLTTRTNPFRVDLDEEQVPYNFGDWFGVDQFGGYTASMPTNIYKIQGEWPARLLLEEAYYVGTKPKRPDQILVFASDKGLNVYQNRDAFPPAWTVHSAERLSAAQDIPVRLQQPLEELRRKTFLREPPPALETCAAQDDVRLAARDSNNLVVEALMRCRGMVIVSDPYFPGWQAAVDGKRAHIYQAYGFLRGVIVEAGRHRVEMRYRPASVIWGGGDERCGLCIRSDFGLEIATEPRRLKEWLRPECCLPLRTRQRVRPRLRGRRPWAHDGRPPGRRSGSVRRS